MATAAAVSSFSHPRRRPASPGVCTDFLVESLANMSLRKGVTFHSPSTNDAELLDPFDNSSPSVARSLTARSTTCPKELEDLLVGAGERRTHDFLSKVEEAVNNQSKEQLGSILSEPDVLPVPAFLLEGTSLHAVPDQREERAYDSGLGSSIHSEETANKLGGKDSKRDNRHSPRTGAAITRSVSSVASDLATDINNDHHLSQFAIDQIHRFLVRPILKESALKDFHRLVAGVPHRIGQRQITNIRDLEKTLIFLAPDYSRSPAAYLQFCETSIHCLHATVNNVHESDQRLPADRPYTNSYFLDLVQQIRRYAQILAASRERQAQGEQADDMDATPSSLELRGGMSQTGRPAELGYRKKDQLISLATGQPLPSDGVASVATKHTMSHEVDDDGVHRSMARRKKGELPKTYSCSVVGCTKVFNRPCDRSKHLKTHERPYKCTETQCEFSSKGFPTEKERDRHWSDRHDPNAKTWDCHFKDSENCTYSSKREHNLKSHMEKAHGWEYVRSKGVKNIAAPKSTTKPSTNGKAKAKTATPRSSIGSSSSSASTPYTLASASPAMPFIATTSHSPDLALAGPPSSDESFMDVDFISPTLDPQFAEYFNQDIFGNGILTGTEFLYTPSLSDSRRASHVPSSNGTPTMMTPFVQGETSFDDLPVTIPPTPEDLDLTNSLFSKNFKEFNFGFPNGTTSGNGMFFDGNNDMNNNYGPIFAGDYYHQTMPTHAPQTLQNDPTLTTTQNYLSAEEGFGGDALFGGRDFQLDHYLDSTDVNVPLFESNHDFDVGSQFNEASSDPNPAFDPSASLELGSQIDKPLPDSNPFKHLFPELQQDSTSMSD